MQFDRKAKESLILGAVGTLLLAFGLANHGLPDSLFTDRSKPLDDDPQVVRVMKAQFAEAESKNDVMGACVAGGMVGAMYANAEDEVNAEFWVEKGEKVCSQVPGLKALSEVGREAQYLPSQ